MVTGDSGGSMDQQGSAVSRRGARIHNLDMLRGLAALLVLVYHAIDAAITHGQSSNSLFSGAYLAVDIFFVMSGFVIPLSYERRLNDGMSLSTFAWVRVLRLWPIYAIGSAVGVGFALAISLIHFDGLVFSQILVEGGFAAAMLPSPGNMTIFPHNAPAWTLLAEMLANLLFAGWAIRWRLSTWMLSAALCGGALIAFVVLSSDDGVNVGAIWQNVIMGWARAWFGFCMGYFIYRLRRMFDIRIPSSANIYIATFLLICIAPCPSSIKYIRDIIFFTAIAPMVTFFLIAANSDSRMARMSEWLGDLSYPIYAVHMPVICCIVWANRFAGLNGFATVALACVTSVLFAFAAKTYGEARVRGLLVAITATPRRTVRNILTSPTNLTPNR